MEYIKVSIAIEDPEMQDIAIACLAELEFDSFENTMSGINAYVPSHLYNEAAMLDILSILQLDINYTIDHIAQQNWNTAWEQNFEPVLVNDILTIRAPFHSKSNTKYEIVIEPKMSFGTGHHATTSMMCDIMLSIDFSQKQVLDFGSGTGILSILASKLGAISCMGIDNEEWAVENSIENAERNKCSSITFVLGESEKITGTYDIVLANINKHIILQNKNVLVEATKPGGILLLSGILINDEEDITNAISDTFIFDEKKQRDGWLALKYIKNK